MIEPEENIMEKCLVLILYHQGLRLYPTDSDNILAIQSVGIKHSGNYSCSAGNDLGIDESEEITVDVKCK